MSVIRYFDDVPHICRYGMRDDKEEKCWILFWRNGVGFRVHVEHDDIRNTPFAKVWLKYVKEPAGAPDPASGKKTWVDRYQDFCDLIISQSMPLLKQLAPDSKYWITLDDYLHTPSYNLKLMTDTKTGDASPSLVDGPEDKPAYENWPTAAANIKHLPQDVRRFHAKHLVVLDKEENWRSPPKKVQSTDGQLFDFYPCRKTTRHMPDKTFSNQSIDVINTHSLLFREISQDMHILQLRGVVLTEPSRDIKDSSPSAGWRDYPEARNHGQTETDDQLIAGILLTYLADSKSLAEVLKDESNKPTTAQRDKWKDVIKGTVEQLHSRRISIGGHERSNKEGSKDTWYYINQHTVKIADLADGNNDHGTAWLELVTNSAVREDDNSNGKAKFEREREMDLEGIEKTFDF